MEIILDGRSMTDRELTHDLLAEKLPLPGYYGRNLDALFDLLTDCAEDIEITIVHGDEMLCHLGSYGQALLDTLWEAARENAKINISISNEII